MMPVTDEYPEPSPEFVLKVLRIFDDIDSCDDLFWRTPTTGCPYSFFAMCNDVFWWGTADLEEITESNVHVLEQAISDIRDVGHRYDHLGPGLFASRIRKMRPQGAWYRSMRKPPSIGVGLEQVLALFDASGPERETDITNPVNQLQN